MKILVKEDALNLLSNVMVSNETYYDGLCAHKKFSCAECNIPPRDKNGNHLCEHGRHHANCNEASCGGVYNLCRRIIYKARERAKTKKVPCTLTAVDVYDLLKATKGICPILGLPFEYHKRIQVDSSPSIDRHVPEKGYTKENCSIISWLANRLKSNGTAEQLQKVADYAKMVQGI